MDLSKETIESVAHRLEIEPQELRALAQKAPKWYRSWKKPKKSGKGFRIIEDPFDNLKKIQKRLLDRLLNEVAVNEMLFGGKGSSTKKAVERHTHKSLVITMDIKDFYPSVKRHMVRATLRARGASPDLAEMLTRLTTYNNHVPHGAPTSSQMTRIVLHPVAEHIERLMQGVGHNSSASIYVDDLTVSGPYGLARLQKTIIGLFARHGFTIHDDPAKTRLMHQDEEQIALGIKVNHGIEVSSEFVRKYKAKKRELGTTNKTVQGMQSYIRSLTE